MKKYFLNIIVIMSFLSVSCSSKDKGQNNKKQTKVLKTNNRITSENVVQRPKTEKSSVKPSVKSEHKKVYGRLGAKYGAARIAGARRPGGARITGGYKAYRRMYKKARRVPGRRIVSDVAHNTESYDLIKENVFQLVKSNPLSTFSIDVDTASYANIRRFIGMNKLPPADAVRIEEMINYFRYNYVPPRSGSIPFSVNAEITTCPWNKKHKLARIGIKGKEVTASKRPPANLVFLIDVSGSMYSRRKLPLLKRAFKVLLSNLQAKDRVAMVVYAGASGLVLSSTSCDNKAKILQAIDALKSGGSTNAGAGITLAYQIAEKNFVKNGVNRVILATDGDFNVGVTNRGDLIKLIAKKAKKNIFLTVLGFGMGNYKDSMLEKIADKGNGNYSYIDSYKEAVKVFGKQIGGTLMTIAKDVKIQIEFNPAKVAAYRLIGYENRKMAARDFNDDTKDAGELGAGHTVTALYELVPPGVSFKNMPKIDKLRYQKNKTVKTPASMSNELMLVKIRYKKPAGTKSALIKFPVKDWGGKFSSASEDTRFASAVAMFGMLLRKSEYKGNSSFKSVVRIASEALGKDKNGYRKEFVALVKKAATLK